jgi:hypothetical protein
MMFFLELLGMWFFFHHFRAVGKIRASPGVRFRGLGVSDGLLAKQFKWLSNFHLFFIHVFLWNVVWDNGSLVIGIVFVGLSFDFYMF